MLKRIIRNILSTRYASPVRTALTPLDRIKSAAVFMPQGREDTCRVYDMVTAFFRKKGIPFTIYLPGPLNTDFLGRVTYYGGPSQPIGEEDLFISLFAEDCFASEFAARSSRAMFKVGRSQLKGEVYDLVITSPGEGEYETAEVFSNIADILEKIN